MTNLENAKIAYYFHVHGDEAVYGLESPVLLLFEYPKTMADVLQKPTILCGDLKVKFSISRNGFFVTILSDDQDREVMQMIEELMAVKIAPENVSVEQWREDINSLVNTLAVNAEINWESIKKFHKFHCENDASS